jgi:multidrug transporter EmrE-like cation transporter
MIERLSASTFLAFGAYVFLGVVGLVLLRANLAAAVPLVRSGQLTAQPVALSALGALAYGSSFATWLVVLARVPLSVAYPVAVGATIALSSVLAWSVLGEPMTKQLVLGIAVIFAGVVVVSTA